MQMSIGIASLVKQANSQWAKDEIVDVRSNVLTNSDKGDKQRVVKLVSIRLVLYRCGEMS